MAQTRPFPTPADVKALPLSVAWQAAFAAVPDDVVQVEFINNVAEIFGSPEVLQHTQRNEAVLYGAAHLLALRLIDEGIIAAPGGGGDAFGPLSSVKLDGVGTKSFAVAAWSPEQLNDWLTRRTPFSVKLHMILRTFPPVIYVVGMCDDWSTLSDYYV